MHQYTHREMHTSVIKIPGESLQHRHLNNHKETYTHNTPIFTYRTEHINLHVNKHMLRLPQDIEYRNKHAHTHTDAQIHILVIKFREGVIDTYTHTIHPTQRIEHVYINMDTHMLTLPQMHTSAIEILGDGHPSP